MYLYNSMKFLTTITTTTTEYYSSKEWDVPLIPVSAPRLV